MTETARKKKQNQDDGKTNVVSWNTFIDMSEAKKKRAYDQPGYKVVCTMFPVMIPTSTTGHGTQGQTMMPGLEKM